MKAVFATVGIGFLIGGSASAAPSSQVLPGAAAESALNRFEESYRQAAQEDLYFTKVLRSLRSARETSGSEELRVPQLTEIQDLDLRAEWQLRFPERFPPVEFSDLQGVRQARLLDLGLWQILMRNYGSMFEDPEKFLETKIRFRDFLRARPSLRDPKLLHSAWWSALADGRYPRADGLKNSEESGLHLLSAMESFDEGMSSQSAMRVKSWLEARLSLYSLDSGGRFLPAFDKKTLDMLRRDARSPAQLVLEIEGAIGMKLRDVGVLTFVEQKVQWLSELERQWKTEGLWSAAATANAAKIALTRASNKDLRYAEVVEGASLWLLAKDYDRSLEFFGMALPLARNKWERGLAWKGHGEASLLKSRVLKTGKLAYQEWAIEYFRRSLADLTSTAERDDVLNLYSEALGELGFEDAVADVYESIFRGGSSEESQISGLVRLMDALDSKIQSSQDLSKRTTMALKYVSLLAAFARAQSYRPEIVGLFTKSLRHRKELKLEEHQVFSATLFEVENVLMQRRTETEKASDRGKKKSPTPPTSKRRS